MRLLTAAHEWRNPNDALLNGITVVLLILSYNSTSLVITIVTELPGDEFYVGIVGFPFLLLGVAVLFQVVISVRDAGSQNIDVELFTFRFDRRSGPPHPIKPVSFPMHAWRVRPGCGWRSSEAVRVTTSAKPRFEHLRDC